MTLSPIQYCQQCGTALIKKLHSGKLRPSCPKCGWVYFPDPKVAVAALIRKDDQVLLVQRKYDPKKGFWTLPSGFVDAGEDPKQAVKRECLEETGLEVITIKLLDVVYSQEHIRGASILIIYHVEACGGLLKAGDDAASVAFFSLENLPPLAFESTKMLIASNF